MINYHFLRSFITATAVSFVLCFVSPAFAQNPGVQNNATGMPGANDLNRAGGNATIIFGNSDGSNSPNEFIYFKVNAPGKPQTNNYEWYTNPTAWMDPSDFHLYNTNLRLYSNFIKFNNAAKSRRIIFDQDTWSTDDNQFTGLGSTDNNDLRYQIKDATKSHKFFSGSDSKSSKSLLTINGNGSVQIPKAGKLELGADVKDKEANAGCIAYKMWSSDGLDIVGAGTTGSNRIVKVWAENGTSFNGMVSIGTVQNGGWHMVPPTTLPGGVDLSTYKLFVNGGILSKEVRVETDWADYVFKPDYKLLSLLEVEKKIKELGHLPGMPSAHEIEQNGLNLGTVAKLQQEKIEELTLHLITMKKELDALRVQMSQRIPASTK